MKNLVKILSVMLLAVLLSSCGVNLSSGSVVGKEYHKAYFTVIVSYIHVGKALFPQYTTIRIPEKWVVTIQGISKGESVKIQQEVNKAFYEKVRVGDEVTKAENGTWRIGTMKVRLSRE